MIGQLPSQVNSAHCMLDYVSEYFMLFHLRVERNRDVGSFALGFLCLDYLGLVVRH
jgi:hypothetical protein